MKGKSVILVLALVLLAPFAGVASIPVATAQDGGVEPISYVSSINYTETLGIAASLGRAARAHAEEEFGSGLMTKRYEEIFESVVSGAGGKKGWTA